MEEVRTGNWMQHMWKILTAGGILAVIGVILPTAGATESIYGYSMTSFFWYFGSWWGAFDGNQESGFIGEIFPGTNYVAYGLAAVVLLIIACTLMNVAANNSKNEKDIKLAAILGSIGAIMAFVGPAIYYFGVKREIPGFFGPGGFDPSFGFFLPIIGGILGIIGAIGNGYAYSLEIKAEPIEKTHYKPIPEKMVDETQGAFPSQEEKPNFCKNCGAKLIGAYCQECGTKAEF